MIRSISIGIVAALAAGAAAACGGGNGRMSAEAYLEALDDRLAEADGESEELFLDPEFLRVANSTEPLSNDDRDIVRDSLERVAGTFDGFLVDVEDLDPPEDLQEEHDELLASYRELDQQFADIVLSRVDSAVTMEDINNAFDELTAAAGDRVSSACLAMQAEAAVNDVQVDLDC